MCNFFSFIVTEGGLLYDMNNHSHTHILEKHGIRDVYTTPDFVRIELSPTRDIESTYKNDFIFAVDQDFKPSWFNWHVERDNCFKAYQLLLASHRKEMRLAAIKCNARNIAFIQKPTVEEQWLAVDYWVGNIRHIQKPCLSVQLKAVYTAPAAIGTIKNPYWITRLVAKYFKYKRTH